MQKLRAHDSLETFVGSAATNGSARLRKISYCTMPVHASCTGQVVVIKSFVPSECLTNFICCCSSGVNLTASPDRTPLKFIKFKMRACSALPIACVKRLRSSCALLALLLDRIGSGSLLSGVLLYRRFCFFCSDVERYLTNESAK